MTNKYTRTAPNGATFDTYDVLAAYGVACPATAHAVKKLLAAGQRGHKDRLQDLTEAQAALARAIELEQHAMPMQPAGGAAHG